MIEGTADSTVKTRLRYGMVGGGPGAFIGDVHRRSIALDGLAVLTAGCFSRTWENTLATGRGLGVPEDRLYKTFEDMAAAEASRPDKIDFAVIVTPNAGHYPAAKAFLSRGIPVVCDKPFTLETAQAEELRDLAREKDLLLGITYTYTGYPAVKEAKSLIDRGEIGEIRFVNAEYPQEWLALPAEKGENKQAAWRTDPKLSGKSNCVGDIGSHIENMISYTTGLRIKAVSARLDTFVEGRTLDDNATILVEYDEGAKGLYWASQVAVGYDNALKFRIFGSKGTIQWTQELPNYLEVFRLGKPNETLSRGKDKFHPHAQSFSRLPSGHPEGYFEALGNIYKTYIGALVKQKAGEKLTEEDLDFPDGDAGVDGVKFISKCVESSENDADWVAF